jgi:hypothetical protein
MSDELRTNGDAVDIIENEGLGYAVQHYISGDSFADAKTARLWNEADRALAALVTHLERETGREVTG